MIISNKMERLKCQQCGHKWLPRVEEVVMCPKCKSHKWKEKKIKK